MDRLRWRTGAIGCLLPLLVLTTTLFAFAATRPSLAAELADERRGHLIAWTSSLSAAGINVPLALLALYLGWETIRLAWRWIDEIAVAATDRGLVPHRSLFMRPIAWAEIADVRFVRLGRAPSLLISLREGGSRSIRGVDNEGGAAEHFAASARRRLAGHGSFETRSNPATHD